MEPLKRFYFSKGNYITVDKIRKMPDVKLRELLKNTKKWLKILSKSLDTHTRLLDQLRMSRMYVVSPTFYGNSLKTFKYNPDGTVKSSYMEHLEVDRLKPVYMKKGKFQKSMLYMSLEELKRYIDVERRKMGQFYKRTYYCELIIEEMEIEIKRRSEDYDKIRKQPTSNRRVQLSSERDTPINDRGTVGVGTRKKSISN